MSDRDICGSADTSSGDPCQRDAGWGTDVDHGPCKDHRGPGRPSDLTHDRQEAIASEIESGTPVVAACRLNGITHKTHRRWMKRGDQQDHGIYAEYCQRLARALGHDQSTKTEVLWETAEASNDTATMLTVLKQRYPETWEDQNIGEAQGGIPLVVPDNAIPDN